MSKNPSPNVFSILRNTLEESPTRFLAEKRIRQRISLRRNRSRRPRRIGRGVYLRLHSPGFFPPARGRRLFPIRAKRSPNLPEAQGRDRGRDRRTVGLSLFKVRQLSRYMMVIQRLKNTISPTEHLDVSFVAEHHENLQHILVFLIIRGLKSGSHVQAQVVSSDGSSRGKQLLLECDAGTSPMLCLPARVPIGKKEVRLVPGTNNHFEIKLPTSASSPPPTSSSFSNRSRRNTPSPIPSTIHEVDENQIQQNLIEDVPMLDATQLSSLSPTSFICASCSLPLVQASRLHQYRDLPSEHWAELVDAWMCHADLKLHDEVKKGSKDGFWPEVGEGLVGGSYVLVHEDAVTKTNFCDTEIEVEKVRSSLYPSQSLCFWFLLWGSVHGCIRKSTLGISSTHGRQSSVSIPVA